MSRLKSKVALITGGAQGIGEACVRQFIAEGANVLIGDIQGEKGAALADELGASALFHELDVTSEDQFSAAIAMAVDSWGRFDIQGQRRNLVTDANRVRNGQTPPCAESHAQWRPGNDGHPPRRLP
jgi:NAD(P)-dependent dehydrogenase (short-subunit alcohol dehydrogenase family)